MNRCYFHGLMTPNDMNRYMYTMKHGVVLSCPSNKTMALQLIINVHPLNIAYYK